MTAHANDTYEHRWDFSPKAGWDEYRVARARLFEELAEQTTRARLEAARVAPPPPGLPVEAPERPSARHSDFPLTS